MRLWPTDVQKLMKKNSKITSFVWSDDSIVFDSGSFSVQYTYCDLRIRNISFLQMFLIRFVSYRLQLRFGSMIKGISHRFQNVLLFMRTQVARRSLFYESNVSLPYHLLCCVMISWVRGSVFLCVRILCFVRVLNQIRAPHILKSSNIIYVNCAYRVNKWMLIFDVKSTSNHEKLPDIIQMRQHERECVQLHTSWYWVLLSIGLKPLNFQELNARICLKHDIQIVLLLKNSQIETYYLT